MNQKKLYLLSATESIKLIKLGRISSKELVESCATQIEKNDKKIHALVMYNKNNAIQTAEYIDNKIKEGSNVGMLCGIPVAIKDIFNTLDFPTQHGSSIRKGYTPGNDARVVFRLKQENGIIIGKTVTAEFGVHYPGPTVNPHDFKHSPGTSSSGSAAAVASFMVPLALGSQTAGSTLRPASYCGIYGFKPSFGLIPRTGMLKTTDTLDNVGLMARTIDDLELLFDVVRVSGIDH
ncbi:MAG: amidase, partial [Nanoarchaeota archaeon]